MFRIRNYYTGILVALLSLSLAACGGGDGGNGGAPLDNGTGGGSPALPANLKGGSIQGTTLSLTGNVTTYAGLLPATDGAYPDAHLALPNGITSYRNSSGDNYLYVADSQNQIIRQVDLATGYVSTIAGSGTPGFTDGTGSTAQFNFPEGVTTDGTNLYIADTDNHVIRQVVIATGAVTTLAGSGSPGYADGTGQAALFNYPEGITTDGTNLYVADTHNNRIRKVVISTGAVSTLAGTGDIGSADGSGTAATFFYPMGIYYDKNTNLIYVADTDNHLIRSVDPGSGQVSTLAGDGSPGLINDTGNAAEFNLPHALFADSNGTNLYIADSGNNVIRQFVIATAAVSTLSGTGNVGHKNGALSSAEYDLPEGIAVDANDNSKIYVADTNSNTIRQISTGTGSVTTLAGVSSLDNPDGIGNTAQFYYPNAITTDGTNLYVTDSSRNIIRKITIATADVTTLAGSGVNGNVDGSGTSASFYGPSGITTDGKYLYVADSFNNMIREIEISNGAVTTLAGSGDDSYINDSNGLAASFATPFGITYANGELYIADTYNNVIRKFDIATGAVTTFAGAGPGSSATAATAGNSDSLAGSNSTASFTTPHGITTDGTYLYVADTGNNLIRQIDIQSGEVTTLAGDGTAAELDGTGTKAEFNAPAGISTDGANLYITDQNAVRQVAIASGVVTTLAGSATYGHSDGSGSTAMFATPQGITTDDVSLYICDSANNTLRKLQ